VALLDSGEGFADLSHWRKVAVGGADALPWLDSLVSADLDGLAPGEARHALLLSPTGRVRAQFTVAVPSRGDRILLVQDPAQPRAVDRLLAPYVLSSDVVLEDRTEALALFALPGRSRPPDRLEAPAWSPSCLGRGVDLAPAQSDRERTLSSLRRSLVGVDPSGLEAWRVAAGLPRVGTDVAEEDLPQEAGLAGAVSPDKGCFLGQEAVARARNLGHPRRILLQLHASEPVLLAPGDPVMVRGRPVGRITGVASWRGGTVVRARVPWEAREGPFLSPSGVPLEPVPSP
jgi:folate-binding protein YgfZ